MLKYYHEFKAKNNYELGLQLGRAFKKEALERIARYHKQSFWQKRLIASLPLLHESKKIFPQYIAELKGYAKSAGINFFEFWTMSLEDELDWIEHCTSVITNKGRIVAHNEDFDHGTENSICLLKKTIGDLTIFELFYYNTLGGNAASMNSHGVIQLVNTLKQTDRQIGVPKNIIGRWMSESRDPKEDFQKLKKIRRSSGYSFIFVKNNFGIIDLECTAKKQLLRVPALPHVHTNHYMSKLKKYERYTGKSSYERYAFAKKNAKKNMTIKSVMNLMNDSTLGFDESVMNENTIGKMICDFEKNDIYVWLLREASKGFIKFDFEKIFK